MQQIIFATSNAGKAKTLARRLDPTKYRVVQKQLDISEIQADSALEIAVFKAQYAFAHTRQPVIVQDSSFHIHALNNFPGPYVKFINETLEPDGIIKLMQGVEDRSCHFEQALAYADANGVQSFVHQSHPGRLADQVFDDDSDHAWSALWKIYIPPGSRKVLAALTTDELKNLKTPGGNQSEFAQFIRWLEQR